MVAYYFVAATVLAVLPILVVFKNFIERIRENPDDMHKILRNFMIAIAVIETLPILLIVLGFTNLEPVSDITELYIPAIIVLLTVGLAIVFVFMQRFVDIEVDTRQFRVLTLAVSVSIPLISLVAFTLMLP